MDTNNPIFLDFANHLSNCVRYDWCDKLANGYRKLKWYMPNTERSDIDRGAVIAQRQAISNLYFFLLGCQEVDPVLFPVSNVERWLNHRASDAEDGWNMMSIRVSAEMFDHIRTIEYKPNPLNPVRRKKISNKKNIRPADEHILHERMDIEDLYHTAAIHHIRIMAAKIDLFMAFAGAPATWPKASCKKIYRNFEIVKGTCDDYDGPIGEEIYRMIQDHLAWSIANK